MLNTDAVFCKKVFSLHCQNCKQLSVQNVATDVLMLSDLHVTVFVCLCVGYIMSVQTQSWTDWDAVCMSLATLYYMGDQIPLERDNFEMGDTWWPIVKLLSTMHYAA